MNIKNAKTLLPQRDLIALLPTVLVGYTVLFFVMLAGTSGGAPTLPEFLGNLVLMFWSWFALFVVNTVLYRIEVRNAE